MTDYVQAIINGTCTGFGGAIGGYFATKYAIKHLTTIDEKRTIAGKKLVRVLTKDRRKKAYGRIHK